jgi:tRNA (guanine-N(7)-)-methyltransferase
VAFVPQPLDVPALFGRNAPLLLEIGFGMGDATAQVAAAHPAHDIIGIEVHEPGVGALLRQIGERGLTNLRLVQHDAVEVLREMIAPATLAGVHLWFPDPWHKKRHHKRRLVQPAFVELVASRLAPGGYLAMTRWIKLPPRDTLKLFATAVAALERRAVASPGRRLALIRGWQTSTLLVKNGDFSAAEIDAIRAFCSARAFDVAWYPGMPADEANRRNVLQEPIFYRAAVALLGPERAAFLADYKFNLRPATDDRPYFFHFFKWRTLPEILRLRGQGGMPLLEAGYLVLAATLLQALLVSGILILAPIGLWRRRKPTGPADFSRPRVLVYFLTIGLAFLFMEIAFIQKFILFLSHPLYAAAAVLSAFLIFAGLGSGFSERLGRRTSERAAVACAVAAIAVLGVVYLLVLGPIFKPLMGQPGAARVAIAVALIAPLAFAMGMPFPLALGRLAKAAPDLIPWAWAVNGCASVLSAVLATLLAIHLGFNLVVMLAIGLYGVAWASFPRS